MKPAIAVKSRLVLAALAMLCGFALAQSGCGNLSGCGGLTGFGNAPFTGCGGGQGIPPQSSVNFVGTNGTVFRAIVSDTVASYTLQATVPLKLIYVNNVPPLRVLATNLSPNGHVLSVQALSGFTTTQLATTSVQGSTVSVNVGGPLPAIAAPPVCDVRFIVSGPPNQAYEALLEQNNNAYENLTTAPTYYLLGRASGDVDGVFTEISPYFGAINVQLVINGVLNDIGAGNNFTVKSGCP
jgi:hypothetical protein